MNKDDYRRKMDSIHVRESLLDEIRAAEQTERVEKATKEPRRHWWIAIPTAAAAVAVACLAVFVGFRPGVFGKKDVAPMAVSAEYAAEEPAMRENADFAADGERTAVLTAQHGEYLAAVDSYETLGQIMAARSEEKSVRYSGGMVKNESGLDLSFSAEADTAPMEPMPTDSYATDGMQGEAVVSEEGKNYSGTNNQVAGVDEADIVKTDGTWIYALNRTQEAVYLFSAEGKETKIVSSIRLAQPGSEHHWRDYSEMMLYGDRLYILGTYYDWDKTDRDSEYTFAEVYDVSHRTAPKKLTALKQQGGYRAARLVDDLLVIVSDYRMYMFYKFEEPAVDYCPRFFVGDDASTLTPGEIYVNPDTKENGFTVITTVNAKDGSEYDSHKAVLGGCDVVYCNGADLLIAAQEYDQEQSEEQTDANGKHFVKINSGTNTTLFRFSIIDGKIEAVASAKIPGVLLNQFSMDAYQGTFRLVVTRNDSEETIWTDGIDTYEWNSTSDCALYVLDGELKTLGVVENLAKDERIQSARFMGDTAYFVTFRQVDPLFAVDLSDPENPKVLSALKIPGFSAYLHPFGEGKLLGIGYDADEEHGWTENVKLSLFDISDPADVKEAFKLSVKDASYTSVQYNHKAVFVDAATGTVAFPADNTYYVFRLDGGKLEPVGKISIGDGWSGEARGLFIDDAFYVVGEERLVVLSFETMEQLKEIKLS